MELKNKIDSNRLPKHIAIIMDGNGRWARQRGKERIFGYQNGVDSVRDATEAAAELGVKYLTLYAFSTENWNRPKAEVQALMGLLVESIRSELPKLNQNKIRLKAIGNLQMLPAKAYERLMEAIENTKSNDRMTLVLALSYSAKWEMIEAVKNIATEVKKGTLDVEDIDEKMISNGLTTRGIPDPELLIRTSGETRISNFLLWQIAYAELYFTEVFWPDFRKKDLYHAILNFQQRERRFGMTSEQLLSKK